MSFFSLMLGLFSIIFWILRIAVALTASMRINFLITPFNLYLEIALLFVTFFCILLIFKRSILGGLLYLLSYVAYFGYTIYSIFETTENIALQDYFNALISVLGILLALITFIDIGFSRSSNKGNTKTKKTDWYYKNDKYDREYDERADQNQYKL